MAQYTITGNAPSNRWRVKLTYEVTETLTTVSVRALSATIECTYGYSVTPTGTFSGTINIGGTAYPISTYTGFSPGETNEIVQDHPLNFSVATSHSNPIVINKTTQAQTISVSITYTMSKWKSMEFGTVTNYNSATSSATGSVSIGALAKPTITTSVTRSSTNASNVDVLIQALSYANDSHKYYVAVGSSSAQLVATKTQAGTTATSYSYTLMNQPIDAFNVSAYVVGNGGQSDTSTTTLEALPKPTVVGAFSRNEAVDTTIDVSAEISSWNGDAISSIVVTVDGVPHTFQGGEIAGGTLSFSEAIENQSQGSLECSIVAIGRSGESASYTYTVPTAFFTMDIGGGGKSIAFGGQAPDTNLPANGRMDILMELFLKGKSLLDAIYPVGSIYMSTNDVSPQQFFGGTWVRIGVGRTLISAGGGTDPTFDVNNYPDRGSYIPTEAAALSWFPAGQTGGQCDHALTVGELASHTHALSGSVPYNTTGTWSGDSYNGALSGSGSKLAKVQDSGGIGTITATLGNGSGTAHNIMQPYLAVYMWKRTA